MNAGFWTSAIIIFALVVDFIFRIVAIIVVPRNRRPTSATAWLLAINFIPYLGLLVFLLIGFQARVTQIFLAWRSILIAYVVVMACRIVVTYVITALMPKRESLPRGWTAVLAWPSASTVDTTRPFAS